MIKTLTKSLSSPKILCVDDDIQNRELLRRALEPKGYAVLQAPDGEEALAAVYREQPDVILLDIGMPGRDGYSVCQALKQDPRTKLIPIIMLTGLNDRAARLRCLDLGADEFLGKPFDLTELLVRVRALVSLKRYTDELTNASTVLGAVAQVVTARDQQTGDHCGRVGRLATRIASALGVDEEGIKSLQMGGMLHDLGKIAIPDAILSKPGKLTAEEFEAIKAHPVVGARLIEPLQVLRGAHDLILHHHEKLDGSGYPNGLKGDQISVLVRILSVSDIFDVLTTKRPYKEPLTPEQSLSILREESKRGWWDGEVVETLARTLG